MLGHVGAVEEHRVAAVLALDGVAAVAGIPLERVVAGSQEGNIRAPVSVDEVVPVTADEAVVAVTAVDRVVVGAAVDRERRQASEAGAGVDRVVAGEAVHEQALGSRLHGSLNAAGDGRRTARRQ